MLIQAQANIEHLTFVVKPNLNIKYSTNLSSFTTLFESANSKNEDNAMVIISPNSVQMAKEAGLIKPHVSPRGSWNGGGD